MSDSGPSNVSIQASPGRNGSRVPFSFWRRDVWLHTVIAVFVVAYCISTMALSRPTGFNTFWDGGVYTIAEMLPVIAMVLCALRWPAQRAPWLFIGVGALAHAAGDLLYSFHDQNLVPTPVPASSDYVYLASYVLLVTGVVLLTQSNVGRVRAAVRVEGLAAGLAVAALAALLWFGPVLAATGSLWHVIVADAYPVGNLVLLVLLVSSLAPIGYQPNVPVALFLAAVAWFVFGDVVYFSQSVDGTYVSRTFLNATWVIGLWLVALAATAVDRRRSGALRRKNPTASGVTWVPIGAAFVCAAVLLSYLVVTGVDQAAMVLASLGLVLAGVNFVMTRRDIAAMTLDPHRVDVVTGLMTRVSFSEQIERMLADAHDGVVGVVVLDIVDFAGVNDAIGYAIADELLWVIGRRAQHRLGEHVVFARVQGDHFGAATHVSTEEEVRAIAETVRGLTVDRFRLSGFSVGVTGRVGVAVAPPTTGSATELIARAENALDEPAAHPTPLTFES